MYRKISSLLTSLMVATLSCCGVTNFKDSKSLKANNGGQSGLDGKVQEDNKNGKNSGERSFETGQESRDGNSGSLLDPEEYSDDEITGGESVQELCSRKSPLSYTQEIYFPDNGGICPWGVGDNRLKQKGGIATRIEQNVSLALPDNVLICELNFDFPDSQIRYDDHLFLMLDRFILVGSVLRDGYLDQEGDLNIYNWEKLSSMNYDESDRPFCMGGLASTCAIPQTDATSGKFQLEFSSTIVADLAAKLKSVKQPNFRLVTTGDDDESEDCSHSPIEFKVNAKYLKKSL